MIFNKRSEMSRRRDDDEDEKIEDIPILPGEAVDLGLHAGQCIRRQVSTVKEIRHLGSDVRALGYRLTAHMKMDSLLNTSTAILMCLILAKLCGVPVERILAIFGFGA